MAKIPRGLQDHIRAWAKSLYDDVAEHLAVLNKVRTDHADHRTALLALRTLANELKVDYTADKADYAAGRAEVVKLVTDYAAGRAEIVKLVTDVTALTARVTEAAALVNELKLDLSAHTHGGVTAGSASTSAALTITAVDVAAVAAVTAANPAAATAVAPAAVTSTAVSAADVSALAAATASADAAALTTELE